MTELDKIAAVPPYLCIIWQHILKVFRDIKQNFVWFKIKILSWCYRMVSIAICIFLTFKSFEVWNNGVCVKSLQSCLILCNSVDCREQVTLEWVAIWNNDIASCCIFHFMVRYCIKWKRKWQPTTVFLPRESHGERSLQSIGLPRVRHDWTTSLSCFTVLNK